MKKSSQLILIAILLTAVAAGCRSSREASRTEVSAQLPEGASLRQHYEHMVKSYGDWTDVSVPVSIAILSPQNVSVSGRVSMIRGKLIDISMRMFGFEVGRIYITPDSMFMKMKPGKTYMAEPYSIVSSHVPLSIENVQDMLIGRMFMLGDNRPGGAGYGSFDIEPSGAESDEWLAIPKKQPSKARYGFVVGYDDIVRTLMITVTGTDVVCTAKYGDCGYWAPVGELASAVDVNVTGKNKVRVSLQWKWASAKWNEGVDSRWSCPSGYRRVKVADMLKKGISE